MAIRIESTVGHWILPEGDTLFGRSESCGLCINDARLSRQHARFSVSGMQVVVHDLGSHNGVMINGDRIARPTLLSDGDYMVCGPVRLDIAIDDSEAPATILANPITETLRSLVGNHHRSTEAMEALAVQEALRQPPSRLNPAIAAAVSNGVEHLGESTTIRPSEMMPAVSSGALSPNRFREAALVPAEVRRTTSIVPNEAPDFSTGALIAGPVAVVTTQPAEVRRARVLAGLGDPLIALVVGLISGGLVAFMGTISALMWAGAGIVEGQLHLGSAVAAPIADLVAYLAQRAVWSEPTVLAHLVQHDAAGAPFALLFGSWAVGAVIVELALLLGLISATVQRGGPWLHRRYGLVIVVCRNGHHPGWLRGLTRWLFLGLTVPLALVTALSGVRGLHDYLSGCEVRRRA